MDPPGLFYALGFLVPVSIAGFYDWRRNIVPDAVTFPLMLAGMVYQGLYGGPGGWQEALVGGFIFFLFGCFLYRLGGFGGGDVKLMAAFGFWLGPGRAAGVILAAAIMGIAWGLCKYARLGILRERLQVFGRALYLRLAYGAKLAWCLPRLPGDINAPAPREAVPFGACLAAAALLLTILQGGR
ncbi:A24 family peptidase [Neomoorella mulderi]|uniref:Type IV leader peptidase family protein n=1 Tax=Moorella mulderi DSM 14980 TaxID=1122241 RepID=A0A151AT38_9FIRM|nr:A24 family peptidase [Moorella mulderi]KYH30752.1 type IV leader peptidase family protein [Moorella mulderi DSM 14980]